MISNPILSPQKIDLATAVPGTVILQINGVWQHFTDPFHVITAWRPDEVKTALQEVETAVNAQQFYAAGFMTYEAAAAYDLAVHSPTTNDLPLLWFGLYESPESIPSPPVAAQTGYTIGDWRSALATDAYAAAITRIKDFIARGETYQVNYTFPLQTDFSGDPYALFIDLMQAQEAQYSAYIDLGRHAICSASPELFFALNGENILTRPMKGTAGRGLTQADDQHQIEWLRHSAKNRAENVMIVDMLRNDLGRVAQIGSVAAPQLFTVERYPTLLQMTSTVTARSKAPFTEIMAALFPCASITGAPKIRTAQIIRELEIGPRGVYTGAIGFFGPQRQAQFNVAIRTVVVDRPSQKAVYGVGSGIVWDSDADQEYAECRLKSQVLLQKRPSFDLFESMLWTPDEGYFLLDYHLARLAASADYFNFAFDLHAVRRTLTKLAKTLSQPQKIRLIVQRDGAITSQAVSLEFGAMVEPVRVGLAAEPINSQSVWLYHKTTRRDNYTAARASRPDCDEAILWNERGALTEASSANVVLKLEGKLWTPPVADGLLAGTMRAFLLANGRIRERTLTIADLKRCEEIYLINSVRKWRRAALAPVDSSQ